MGDGLSGGRNPPPVRQRIAARLLLACCTLTIGLGLGTAVAVVGILDLRHPRLRISAPGAEEARLDQGVHQLFVLRNDPGGAAPVTESRPACTISAVSGGQAVPEADTDAGFAAVLVPKQGRYQVACTSAIPLTVDVAHEGERFSAYLAVIGRGLVPAVALTVMASVLAARALVAVRRLPQAEP